MAMTVSPPVAVPTNTAAFLVSANPAMEKSVKYPISAALYVGDLEATVDEGKLYELFNKVAPVLSVRDCRDHHDRSLSLGYAYVNFSTPQDASYARDALNFTPVNNKPIRIMFSNRDPTIRKSGYANLYVKNLDHSVDNKALYDTFSVFGTVHSCKIAYDNNGKPKGYGFVQFDKKEAAQNAMKRLNGMLINDKQVYVGPFVPRQERNGENGLPRFTNVYVKNFPESSTDEDLKEMFEKFGRITSAIVMKDENGKSRCFGFVSFENPDEAVAAVESLNGAYFNEKVLYVAKAEKKAERKAQLKAKYEHERSKTFEKLKGANLYLKNLDDDINDEKLKELFSEFGTIISCKVLTEKNGVRKGAGFVAFSSSDEATKALNEMNGKMIGKKLLYVVVAQKKEERKTLLQAQFSKVRRPSPISPLPGIHGPHPGPAPELAQQQVYYGQVSPAGHITQTAGYGFQQHLPGLMTGLVPSNFVMPLQFQKGHYVQQFSSRIGLANSHQMHQHNNSNHFGNKYVDNAQNAVNHSSKDRTWPTTSIDGSKVPTKISKFALASSLALTTPENRRMMLGEHLYPLVEGLEPNHAGKVTGMLLEMYQIELLHLIESPHALKHKVAEAMTVLRLLTCDAGQSTGAQSNSLS